MKIDAKEIIDALRLFFLKDDVFEIRVLEAVTRRGENGYTSRPHVESGYFDYDHIDTIPQCLEHIISAKGVYFTPNPVDRTLLAKCANRIQQATSGDTTKDCNIVERRWLLIDCDVDHHGVTGISSSDDEHNEALRVCESIKNAMYNVEWPIPMQIDTGNGANLMYPVRMGTSDAEQQIVSDILLALQEFNTENVKIDPAVKNLARLWRLPGTMNCKGDDIPERPHRMCRIWKRLPDDYDILGDEMLTISKYGAGKRTTANVAPVNQPSTLSDGVQSFNIEEWISRYCPECGEPVVTNDTKKWFLSECPWGASHSSPQGAKDTYIAQMPSGAVCFKCSHAHCAGRDWHALRDLKEPDWRTKNLPATDPDVNLSGIVGGGMKPFEMPPAIENEIIEEELEEEQRDTRKSIPIPKELYNVPGIVKSVMELTMKYAPEPNKPLALGGALALMATIISRKVVSEQNATPNIYILLVENSGDGKNFPRVVNRKILLEAGKSNILSDRIGSGAGLEDALKENKVLLWQNDEFQYLLADMANMRQEENNNSLTQYLLTYYSDANSIVKTRDLSGRPGELIAYPHLVILGTTQPPEFFEAMSERILRNGLFARINVLLGEGLKKPDLDRKCGMLEIDDELMQKIRKWCDFEPEGSGNLDVKPMVVKYAADADDFNQQLKMKQYEKRKEVENDPGVWKGVLWSRFREMANRYALIYACSIAPEPSNTIITIDAMKWGAAFVEWDIENRIRLVENHFYRTEYEKNCNKVIDIMVKWHEKMAKKYPDKPNVGMPSGTFNVKLKRFNPIQLKDIVSGLKKQCRLIEIPNQGQGGGSKYYLPEYFGNKRNIEAINGNNMNSSDESSEKSEDGHDGTKTDGK